MSDLFHALPIKRSRQFLVCWLNGILLWLIPMVLCVFTTLLFMEFNLVSYNITGYMGPILIAGLKAIGIWLLAYLTLYHFCLVCAGFSGNAFNAVCSAGLLGIAVISLYGYWDALCGSYFDTFLRPFIRPEQVIWASPLAHAVYIMIYHTNMLFENLQHPVFFLIMTFLMIPANFLAALYLHIRRPSELAERGIQNPVMQHILRICTALLGSLTGLFIFGFITDEAISWMIFGAILFGIFSFGVMNVILNMNFRTFFRHKRACGGCSLFLYIFPFLCLRLDGIRLQHSQRDADCKLFHQSRPLYRWLLPVYHRQGGKCHSKKPGSGLYPGYPFHGFRDRLPAVGKPLRPLQGQKSERGFHRSH